MDFVFNKPHNYYLEILIETGLMGFMIYIVLLVKLLKKLPFYMLPGLVGFMVTNLFGWPVVSTALLFWLWLSWSESN
jgi:O-antigen ligase